MPTDGGIDVEVVYAAPQRAVGRTFHITVPATVADVLRLAAASPEFAGIDVEHCPVGVFGQIVARAQPVGDGDRVELYRPLAADPKTARRARASRERPRPGSPRPR